MSQFIQQIIIKVLPDNRIALLDNGITLPDNGITVVSKMRPCLTEINYSIRYIE